MVNECRLQGRISGAEERQLPSGDEIVVFRLVVPRREAGRVDTIDCVVATAALRRRILAAPLQSELVVEGALRRRFWQSATGPASRYELAVHAARRVAGGK